MSSAASYLYVLKLSNNKYYVGVSRNLQERLKQHEEEQKGSSWTSKFRMVECIHTSINPGPFDEDQKTKELMMKYGINNVRGGSYASIKLSREQIVFLLTEFRTARQTCFVCGHRGHISSACNAERWMCFKCFTRNKNDFIRCNKCFEPGGIIRTHSNNSMDEYGENGNGDSSNDSSESSDSSSHSSSLSNSSDSSDSSSCPHTTDYSNESDTDDYPVRFKRKYLESFGNIDSIVDSTVEIADDQKQHNKKIHRGQEESRKRDKQRSENTNIRNLPVKARYQSSPSSPEIFQIVCFRLTGNCFSFVIGATLLGFFRRIGFSLKAHSFHGSGSYDHYIMESKVPKLLTQRLKNQLGLLIHKQDDHILLRTEIQLGLSGLNACSLVLC